MILFGSAKPFLVPGVFQQGVVAIGNFDGVHLGHQMLLKTVTFKAKSLGVLAGVITFDIHPKTYFGSEGHKLLHCNNRKYNKLLQFGLDFVLVLPSQLIFSQAPQEFTEYYLVETLQIQAIIVGQDFAFGKHRSGNIDTLMKLSKKFNFEVMIVQPRLHDGQVISSTFIRKLLEQGDISRANYLLGENFIITGRVISQQGREFVVELENEHQIIPKLNQQYTILLHSNTNTSPIKNIRLSKNKAASMYVEIQDGARIDVGNSGNITIEFLS